MSKVAGRLEFTDIMTVRARHVLAKLQVHDAESLLAVTKEQVMLVRNSGVITWTQIAMLQGLVRSMHRNSRPSGVTCGFCHLTDYGQTLPQAYCRGCGAL